ncbi:MAG: phosphatidylserine decarboxylase [Alphaproteobacteria bacterium]|nr:phosphatidylserine decarboxylase [Alphaproteobacteria bacterium]
MAAKPLPLPVWDRRAGTLVQEYMGDAPQTYESEPHRSPRQWLESQPAFDWLIALAQNTRWSARKIAPFVARHDIDLSEFEPKTYRSFAEFFDRRFRAGVRPFVEAPAMAAFAEARYFGWREVAPDQKLPVKGKSLDAAQLLGSAERAAAFHGGPALLARLSPVDYHHVHYPDDGTTLWQDRLGSRLWTVNWHALQSEPDILLRNERQVHLLQTRTFGRLAFVEIGALSVGRIAQVHPVDQPFRRGDRKSTFKFGGSAIVVLGESDRWLPSDDILANTANSVETLVRLGEAVGAEC